jgi:hypothetical protein
MSEIKVNKISPRTNCGTVTLGDSGDTIALGAGASQTGFGRNGAVNWQTSIKTTAFTAVSGEGYFCDTNTSGAFAVTLPASPSAGDIVAVADYANSFDTANLTLNRNGSNIEGDASNFIFNVEGAAMTLVYADATKGWIVTESGNSGDGDATKFVTATGGTITTVCTNFKVHTFTGPGTFDVTCGGTANGSNTVDYMVVAGGGGGGGGHGGGGGAGGFRESPGAASGCYSVSPLGAAPAVALTVPAQAYPITVGAGGTAGLGYAVGSPSTGGTGGNSIFSTITSHGGGGGGGYDVGHPQGLPGAGANGGSGGGGVGQVPSGPGGTGNTPPVNPAQGTNGGTSNQPGAAGGGGATAVGSAPPGCGVGGAGGAGATTSINGTPTARAGGGGGGAGGGQTAGAGGAGGGGAGSVSPNPCTAGTAGSTNTGGGGGGGTGGGSPGGPPAGGLGGSGVVIIRYKFQ